MDNTSSFPVLLAGLSLVLTSATNAAPLPLEGRLPATLGGDDYQAYYDPNLDITWATDASLGGAMSWYDATTWVSGLTVGGIGGWRLPSRDVNGDGTLVDCSGGGVVGCEDNEMGFLYWEEGISTAAPGPFINLLSGHWSGTEIWDQPDAAYVFFFRNGIWSYWAKWTCCFWVWPVHSGDVDPSIGIQKSTNGRQADGADDYDVPRVASGDTVTWTYEIVNTGSVAFAEANLLVSDSQAGVTPVLDVATDDGDLVLSPGEVWIYTATAPALDLTSPPAGVTIVPGCNDGRNTYENTGRVDVASTVVFDEDNSHYCNTGDVDADGVTDSADNCFLAPNGPLIPDAGGHVQRDTDGDDFGNVCDPDFDNNLVTNAADLAFFKTKFFSSDPDADLNGDNVVNAADLAILKTMFFKPPGPSGLVP